MTDNSRAPKMTGSTFTANTAGHVRHPQAAPPRPLSPALPHPSSGPSPIARTALPSAARPGGVLVRPHTTSQTNEAAAAAFAGASG